MVLIDTLNIGGIAHTVEAIKDLSTSDADGKFTWANGMIGFQTCRIQIERDAPEAIQQSALIHEALHGILHQAGMDEHPEPVIVALGYGVWRLIKDNPQLIAWIQQGSSL